MCLFSKWGQLILLGFKCLAVIIHVPGIQVMQYCFSTGLYYNYYLALCVFVCEMATIHIGRMILPRVSWKSLILQHSSILYIDIGYCRGGYSKPHWSDVLWIQILISPYTLFMYLKWYINWVWRFNIKGEEYGDEEKFYLIKKYLACSKTQWEVSIHTRIT